MDFAWTDEQQALYDDAVRFARAELNHDVSAREQANLFPADDWKKCADFGIQGMTIPRAYGGRSFKPLTTVLVLEGLGYGCLDNGLPFALNSQMWSFQPAILKFGSEEQKQKYLPPVCRGEQIGAFGITEVETGSDTFGLQMTATKVDGGYVLNGRKSYITLAPVADLAVVFASTDPDLGRWGITAFIVEYGTPGFSRTAVRDKMGLRTTPMGDLIFEECFVPDENRLGPVGSGASLFTNAMESERGYIFASQVGAMQRQLETAIDYARARKAFGQSIGKFQSVSNRVVEMKLRLDLARSLLYKVAWLEEQGKPLLMEAAMAKLYLSEAFVESSLDAIRLHGAKGYVTEFEVERDLRDGVGGLLYSGTSDIQRNIIARLLGL